MAPEDEPVLVTSGVEVATPEEEPTGEDPVAVVPVEEVSVSTAEEVSTAEDEVSTAEEEVSTAEDEVSTAEEVSTALEVSLADAVGVAVVSAGAELEVLALTVEEALVSTGGTEMG